MSCDIQTIFDLLKDLPQSRKGFHQRARNGEKSKIVTTLGHFLRIWGGDADGQSALIFAAVGKGLVLGNAAPNWSGVEDG